LTVGWLPTEIKRKATATTAATLSLFPGHRLTVKGPAGMGVRGLCETWMFRKSPHGRVYGAPRTPMPAGPSQGRPQNKALAFKALALKALL